MSDLAGKTFLVTGATSGIGLATARELVRRGGRVFAGVRSETRGRPVVEELQRSAGPSAAELLIVDLEDLRAVRRAAEAFLATGERLDVLINNAGCAPKPGQQTKDGFELSFGVNHLAHFHLTRLLLDKLKASAPSRVVNVASIAHVKVTAVDWDAFRKPAASFSGMPEYRVSKLCNVLFTRELARRLEGTGVTTYAVHPGFIASDIWRRIPWPANEALKLFMKTNEDGARAVLRCATDPALASRSGQYYHEGVERAPGRLGKDDALARTLWEKSEAWTAGV